MKLPFLRWLLPNGAAATRFLIVQTGSAPLLVRLVDLLRRDHPDAALTVLLQRNMRPAVSLRDGVEYLDNQGPRPAFIKLLRERRFGRAYALYSNEPGYWKLKVLPLLVGASEIYAVNENLDWFPMDLRHTDALAAHMRWRMESSVTFAGDVELAGVWSAAKAAAYPAVLAYLTGYEWLRTRMAGEAGGSWKQENRPDGPPAP